MGESLISAKEDLQGALGFLKEARTIPEADRMDILTRVQLTLNVLIQNERKIWLRTREGKEMLMEFGTAATKLVDAAERMRQSEAQDPKALSDFGSALGEVERCAKRLEEESRRRGMVVT